MAAWQDYQPNVRVKFTFGATCLCCKHFTRKACCAVFPRGIPTQILDGRHDHRTTPWPGDHGVLWESALHVVEEVKDGGDSLQGDTQRPPP